MKHAARAAHFPLVSAFALPLLFAASIVGCAGEEPVSLVRSAGLPSTLVLSPSLPLEVVTRSTAVKDPLPIKGTDVTYTDLEVALGASVSTAAAPWAQDHKDARPGGWQLAVELIQAEATENDGRLVVTLSVRATLRGRNDRSYLGQTQATCREADLTPAAHGQHVVYGCMAHLGRDLASWLTATES